MARFVELAKKFEKSESDIFKNIEPKINIASGNQLLTYSSGTASWGPVVTINGDLVINDKILYVEDGIVKAKDNKPLTRGEKMIAEAKINAILADEYDEYNNLKVDLTNYFNSTNKLING